jgi:hypothetical protein
MPSATFEHLGLTFRCDRYYLKRPRIVEKIVFDNRTFYAKYERIDESPPQLLSAQHLRGDYTVAVPLLNDEERTDYLVFEYKGAAADRFAAFMRRLLASEGYERFELFEGKSVHKVQVFVYVDAWTVHEAETAVKKLAAKIEHFFGRDWKALPSSTLPKDYNIVTLPYKTRTISKR